MENVEIFDQAVAPIGQRFRWESTPEQVRLAYAGMQERAQELIAAARQNLPSLPEIHFDFALNGSINASAFEAKGRYFIGLNTGTIFMLRSVIGRMLSDSHLFVKIGNAADESSDLVPFADYVPNAVDMQHKVALVTPKDPIRRGFAEYLEDQAMLFFVGHEITHIAHGHVAYLKAKRGHPITAEFAESSHASSEERLERQCLEMLADRRSILSRVDSLRITFDHASRPTVPWRAGVTHGYQMMIDWAVSLNIVFRLFGDRGFTHRSLTDSPYPPLPLRRAMCDAAAIWSAQQTWVRGATLTTSRVDLRLRMITQRVRSPGF